MRSIGSETTKPSRSAALGNIGAAAMQVILNLGDYLTGNSGREDGLPVCTENLNPHVMVMKSAKDGVHFDASGRLNQARDWSIFV
jgi:hypothetical protein